MMLFTLDQQKRPGHPTKRFDLARKLCRRGQARILGGGPSGKPPILHFLTRSFDPQKTVQRRFSLVLDPGFRTPGWILAEKKENQLLILAWGQVACRSHEIKGLLREKSRHRRAKRYRRRLRMRKKARKRTKTERFRLPLWKNPRPSKPRRRKGTKKRQNGRLKGRSLVKFRRPRWKNRRRRMSQTLHHLVQTHLNLVHKIKTLWPLPESQVTVGFEDASFDLRALLYGPVKGEGYQRSPQGKKSKEKNKEFLLRRDGGCVVCGQGEGLEKHHLRSRVQGGSDRPQNLVCLCSSCHQEVHQGRLFLPLEGVRAEGAASLLNGLCSRLRKEGLLSVPAWQVSRHRKGWGLPKDHHWDALCTALRLVEQDTFDLSQAERVDFVQYRRHRRNRIHAQRERDYRLNGKSVARNRRKACEQKVDSLEEFRFHHPQDVGRLQVRKGCRLYTPSPDKAAGLVGEVWQLKGQRFICHGTQNKGRYLYSKELNEKQLTRHNYVSPQKCERILRNEGLVIHQRRKS